MVVPHCTYLEVNFLGFIRQRPMHQRERGEGENGGQGLHEVVYASQILGGAVRYRPEVEEDDEVKYRASYLAHQMSHVETQTPGLGTP
jgi:hypothetical protein